MNSGAKKKKKSASVGQGHAFREEPVGKGTTAPTRENRGTIFRFAAVSTESFCAPLLLLRQIISDQVGRSVLCQLLLMSAVHRVLATCCICVLPQKAKDLLPKVLKKAHELEMATPAAGKMVR
jgi:hypothetical protein